ncbi:ZIP family metal transporter [Abyssalbus ytuae]|uniref:ZIP family metal transporter n=1 Tax=Abyssalbus ytuae TaxID=2926907 RepID=A0A9E6ZXW6_9FLAO|nr:ZIP family metal transporter [Abyssalbus ytuae]UOB17197.1 ZIP family metal transporter [Abyssalbus ytuae]
MNYLLPILAVIIGYFFVIILKPEKSKNFKLLLAFSGAFLLSLTVFNILPEVYESENTKTIGVFIMLGILLQIFLEFFSKGAEHGHVHISKNEKSFPWLLFISLSIHSVLEGFPIHEHETLIYGIVIHKLPIAIILSTFFINSEISNFKTIIFLVLFSLMTPLGSFISEFFYFEKENYMRLSAIVIGIFLHISTTILFESSEGHKFNLSKLLVIIIGIITAYII